MDEWRKAGGWAAARSATLSFAVVMGKAHWKNCACWNGTRISRRLASSWPIGLGRTLNAWYPDSRSIAQNVARLHQPLEGSERLGDTIAGAAGGQSLQHDMGGRR